VTYQWHRFEQILQMAGASRAQPAAPSLFLPFSAADVASGVNGYYVTVSGTGGFTTNSTTNALSLRTAAKPGSGRELILFGIWQPPLIALNGGNASVFNLGDNVTFDDTGIGSLTVNLSNNYFERGFGHCEFSF